MARLTPFPTGQELDANGNPLAGGKVYTYEAGTTTLKTTYTTADGTTPNANPVILDSEGRGEIWLGDGAYKIRVEDSNDVLVDERDDVVADSSGAPVTFTVSTNTNVTTAYDNARIYASAALNLSLLPVDDAGSGFEFMVLNTGAGDVTIDPDASETINGAATLVLTPDSWARVSCDGTVWRAFSVIGIQNNLSATTAPTVNDDSDDGYEVNSVWFDTTASPKEAYRCLDATVGAAVWIITTLTTDELGGLALLDILDEDDFSSDSATRPPSQQSAKQYIADQIAANKETEAKVIWDATTSDDKTGTYSRTGTSGTMAVTGHGLSVGQVCYANVTSGAASDEPLIVASVSDANNFVATGTTGSSTSGNVTLEFWDITAADGVDSIVYENTAGYGYINLTTAQADTDFALLGSSENVYFPTPYNVTASVLPGKGTKYIRFVVTDVNGVAQNSAFNYAQIIRV